MNLFNRIVVIILCLALAAGSIAVITLAWTIPDESIDALRDAVNWLEDHNEDLEKSLLTTAGAFIALVTVVVLVLELIPHAGGEVKVIDLRVGDAVLSTAAIGQRVEEAVNQVPHVSDVRAIVKPKGKGVRLSLDLHVDPEANLATVTDEACEAAREVLTNRVHVELVEPPRARIHYRELRLRGRQPAPSPTTPALPPPPVEAEPEPAVAAYAPGEAGEDARPERETTPANAAVVGSAQEEAIVASYAPGEEAPPEERKPEA